MIEAYLSTIPWNRLFYLDEPRYVYMEGEKFEFIDGELWETEISPRPSNE